MVKKRIGVIGCGRWGPNQIRSFFFHPRTEVRRICDKDPQHLKSVGFLYPQTKATLNPQDITRAPDIDAVVIATPVSSHFTLAREALENGKDVLCEKPLTIQSGQARELIRLAERKKRVLMAGHVFLFNPGILKLKELMRSKELGNIYYLHAQRTNPGPVRRDANAVYDLASHDISIFNFLLGGRPRVLSAVGKCYLRKRVEDVAFVSLEYPGGILAHIHVSWLDPKKIRQITVVGDRKMMTWDDLSLSGPVEIYAKGVEAVIHSVENAEPVKQQADHFVECILKRRKPLTDGRFALEVVEVLEEIHAALRRFGR